jgi:hypothetical protein
MNRQAVAAAIAVTVVAGAFLLWGFSASDSSWDGEVGRTIIVRVYGSENSVMPNARVSYSFAPKLSDRIIWQGVTGADGCVTFPAQFGAGGPITRFGSTRGHFQIANNIRVEAEGFRPFESALKVLAPPDRRPISDKRPIQVSVIMHRAENT